MHRSSYLHYLFSVLSVLCGGVNPISDGILLIRKENWQYDTNKFCTLIVDSMHVAEARPLLIFVQF